jgi:hypothetical protein
MRKGTMRYWVLLSAIAVPLCFAAKADVLDHWTTNHVSTLFGLRSVTYGNGRYVAVGGWSDWGAILSSEDGLTWTVRSLGGVPDGSYVGFGESVIYAGGRFVMVGFWGQSAVSADGITWTKGGLPCCSGLTEGCYGVAYGNNTYVAVGGVPDTGDINVFTSPDGQSWAGQHSTSPAGASLGDVAYGANRFVAIGINRGSTDDSGHIYTSTNGINWTRQSIAGGSHVSYCNNRFFIPLSPGVNLVSLTGTYWTTSSTGLTDLLDKIVYSQGAYLARAGNSLAASTDGVNWFKYSQLLPGTSTVASDGQCLVVVGDNSGPFGPYTANGYTYVSDPLVSIRITAGRPPTITVSGLVGRTYSIEATNALICAGSNNWHAVATAQLTSDHWLWTDTPTGAARLYRAVLLP